MSRRIYDIEVTSKQPTPEPQGVGAWLPGAILIFCALLVVIGGLV